MFIIITNIMIRNYLFQTYRSDIFIHKDLSFFSNFSLENIFLSDGVNRWVLKGAHDSAHAVIEKARSYRDSNSDCWIQSPK